MTRQYMRTEEQVFTDKTRELLRLQVHNPSSPFNLIIMVVILIATLAMVLETVDDLNQYINEKEWAVIEAVCVVIFTIELIIKLFVTPVRKLHLFFFSVMNLVDVVAILPFYLTLLTSAGSSEECWTGFLTVFRDNGLNVTSGVDCSTTGGTSFTFLRAFRLARVMRVLKLGNFSAGVKVFTVAIMKSTPQLVAIFFFMMIAMIVFSSIMYYAETGCNADAVAVAAGADDAVACVKQKESFSSIPMTMWWCIVTMTTVGYGDMVPKSPVGMVIAVPTMLAGILIFALPITVIGSNYEAAFHNEVMKRLINELHAGIRQLFKTKSEISLQDVQRLTKKWSSRWTSDHTQLYERLEMMWDMYDQMLDGQLDGHLSKGQINKLIEDLKMQIDETQLRPDSEEQPLVVFDAQGNLQLNGGEGDESTVAALQESSTASAAGGGGRSPPPQRAGGAAVQRKSLGRGGCRGSVRNCAAAAVADTGLQQRVALLEQQLEQQAGALSQIAEALRRVGAALEVELGPLPLPTVPSASPSLHSTGARVTNSEQTT